MIWEIAGRFVIYLPALGVYGVLGVLWLSSRSGVSSERDHLRRLGVGLAGALLIATLFRSLAQSINVWGLSDGLDLESWRTVAFESRWGARWHWQPIAAVATLVGFLAGRVARSLGYGLATAGALGFAVALPMTGHAYGSARTWTAQSAHVLGAGLWIGTLAIAWIASAGANARQMRRSWYRAFTPIAIAGAVTVLTSALVLAFGALPDLSSLWRSTYGRTLSVKALLVMAVLCLGALNNRALRNDDGAGDGSLPKSLPGEIALALLVVTASAVLTSLPQPEG